MSSSGSAERLTARQLSALTGLDPRMRDIAAGCDRSMGRTSCLPLHNKPHIIKHVVEIRLTGVGEGMKRIAEPLSTPAQVMSPLTKGPSDPPS